MGIAAWVVWKDWPFIWAGIIAASQLLDATKHIFPFARHHKAASDLTVALELLCIDAEVEWESIYAGRIPNDGIICGDVIRYAYLWADEGARGREAARKDRPAVVVAVSVTAGPSQTR